jgi:cytochrome b pre-mRNA-processing protein 3
MIFAKLFKRKPDRAQILYEAIVAAARQPKFYEELQVSDTLDGRFDMIVLHLFLLLDRLKAEPATTLRQQLTDVFFKDMDRSLREMGVGDLSVGKKVRKMAESFFGRINAYRDAIDTGKVELAKAVQRNVYPDGENPAAQALATYMLAARHLLQAQDIAVIMRGEVRFP